MVSSFRFGQEPAVTFAAEDEPLIQSSARACPSRTNSP